MQYHNPITLPAPAFGPDILGLKIFVNKFILTQDYLFSSIPSIQMEAVEENLKEISSVAQLSSPCSFYILRFIESFLVFSLFLIRIFSIAYYVIKTIKLYNGFYAVLILASSWNICIGKVSHHLSYHSLRLSAGLAETVQAYQEYILQK